MKHATSAYRLDRLKSGKWYPVKVFPHTEAAAEKAFREIDNFMTNRISSRVIDTETGIKIMEAVYELE
jgi:hypothetical protein